MRKNKTVEVEASTLTDHVIDKEFTDLLDERFTNYAFAVMEDRALPDARDGLKPSQRRTLVAMDDLNLRSTGKTKKCAKICGDVSGNYHPHGEAVVYPTLVRMAQDWSLRYPLISPQGNFGSPAPEDKPAAMRYCLTGDALVYTNKGLVRIDKISSQEDIDITVLSAGNKLNKSSKWFDCGPHPTIKITTTDNFSVTGTHNHPVLTYNYENGKVGYDWKLLSEIKENDYIVLSRKSIYPTEYFDLTPYKPEFGRNNKVVNVPDVIDENLATIMGSIVSEGWIDSKRFGFTNLPGDLLDAFTYALDKTFGEFTYHKFDREPIGWSRNTYVSVEMCNAKICEMFSNLGFDLGIKSKDKSIPWVILQSPKSVVSSFLSALYEGDGSAEINTNVVSYNTKSKILCDQLQVVLLGFGITSKLSYSKSRDIYKVLITGKNDINNFRSEINFVSARKQSLLNIIIDSLSEKNNAVTHGDYIPHIASYLRDNTRNSWVVKHNFDRYNNFKQSVPQLKQNLSEELFKVVEELDKDNYFYQKVVKIEDAEIQNVYSVKVDSDCHSFVANGIVNHNTESKFSVFGDQMVSELSNQVVDYISNYNDEMMEPTVLPSLLPNLIVNGCSGIAVGWATSMAPHNLRETANLIAAYIKNPNISLAEMMEIMPGPDFPLKCKILGNEGVKNYFTTGRGSVQIEGYYSMEQEKNGQHYIKVTALPYGGSAEGFCREIKELVESKKLDGITNLKNLTNKRGMDIRVWIHKTTNSNLILNLILKHTCLRTNFSINSTVLLDGKKVVENVPMLKLVDTFVIHRKEVLTRKFNAELDKNNRRIHILDGLIGITAKIDSVIKLIREADDRNVAQQELITQGFVTSLEQSDAVLRITLGNLTKLDTAGMKDEFDKLTKRNEWLVDILGSDRKLSNLVSREQLELAEKIGDDRRCEIVESAVSMSTEDMIREEQIVVSLSKDGYVKRVPSGTFKAQNRGGKGVIGVKGREEDEASDIFYGSTHDYFLFFSKCGNLYKKKGYEIPVGSRTSKGIHLNNLLELPQGDEIACTLNIKSLDVDGYFIMITKNGLIKRSEIREYNINLRKKGTKAIIINEGDELKFVSTTSGTEDVMLITTNGMAVRYSEDLVRAVGKNSQGVKAMILRDRDSIASMITFDKDADPSVLIITSMGYGKRTDASLYRSSGGRAVKGIKTIDSITTRNGNIVCAVSVTEDDEILVLTTKGLVQRTRVSDLRLKGRAGMGVKVITVNDGDAVQSVIKVDKTEDFNSDNEENIEVNV